MKKILLILAMLLFSMPLFGQFGQKTGTFKVTNDTTAASKKILRRQARSLAEHTFLKATHCIMLVLMLF